MLVQVDGEFGTLYGDGFPAIVEPVDAGYEDSLQLLNEAEKKSYKQMKEGTSDHDAAHAYWLSKVPARLADTEARACIDDIPLVSKGGNSNMLWSGLISRRLAAKPVHCLKTRLRLPRTLRRGISTSTTTRNQRR